MIISVNELRQFITTDKDDITLQAMLEALESYVVKYTNNNFKDRTTGLVVYPADVKMTVVDIMRWKLRNEEQNSGDKSKKDIHSESLSRHSVTYASDSTESDIDENFGVPKKYTAIFKQYKRARF